MDWREWFVVIFLFVLLIIVMEVMRELHTFKVTRYMIGSDKFNDEKLEAKILFISDLHNWEYGNRNNRLIKAVEDESPDLILIGGDILVAKKTASFDTALDFVSNLTKLCPVYYALGNHEQRLKDRPDDYQADYIEYKKELENRGVKFLENNSDVFSIGGIKFVISGLELPLDTYRRFQKAEITAETVNQALYGKDKVCMSEKKITGSRRNDAYHILMAHNPAYMDAYLKWGADLVLSGHLHGGLVRLPFLGGIVTPQGFLFPKYSGEMTEVGDQTVIVSRGLGTHTLNIRFLNTPELISIVVKRDGHPEAGKKTL